MVDRAAHLSRWRAIVADAAARALDTVEDRGGDAESMAVAIPAARTLIDRAAVSQEALSQAWRQWSNRPRPRRLRDSAGHTRAVYGLLVEHLFQCALAVHGHGDLASPSPSQELPASDRDDLSASLWRGLTQTQASAEAEPTTDAMAAAEAVAAAPGPAGELQAFDEGKMLIDVWWYRELVGLHALHALALRPGREHWRVRVREVAAYHMENTQPDHTTAQPWALAAFAAEPATSIFAEQQLHDAMSCWTQARTMAHIEGGSFRAALLPGLLLAHATALLEEELRGHHEARGG